MLKLFQFFIKVDKVTSLVLKLEFVFGPRIKLRFKLTNKALTFEIFLFYSEEAANNLVSHQVSELLSFIFRHQGNLIDFFLYILVLINTVHRYLKITIFQKRYRCILQRLNYERVEMAGVAVFGEVALALACSCGLVD